jgi:hypothetical protein
MPVKLSHLSGEVGSIVTTYGASNSYVRVDHSHNHFFPFGPYLSESAVAASGYVDDMPAALNHLGDLHGGIIVESGVAII